jgi:hypothetical protein
MRGSRRRSWTLRPRGRLRRRERARLGVLVLVVWLVIGAIAAGQRHYYTGSSANCARLGTITVTVLAGPLNYLGVNPRISCQAP